MQQLLLIALATLASEDLACIGAGVMVARGDLGFASAVIACFLGIGFGDVLLYAAGRFAAPLSQRLASRDRLVRASQWLQSQGWRVVWLSRFTPGLRLPTYVAAGFLRMSFGLFATHLTLAGAAWTVMLVGLATLFGSRLSSLTSLPATFLLAFAAFRMVRSFANFEKRRRLIGFLKRKVQWEFWPTWAMYLPLIPYLLTLVLRHRSLAVFTLANPGILSGGLAGESKFEILRQLAVLDGVVPRTCLIRAGQVISRRIDQAAHWSMPFVLKPNVGERGRDVAIIRTHDDLCDYFKTHSADTILQEYVPGFEAGIFYIRYPREATGHIVSVALKSPAIVTGDGKSTLAQLIWNDPRAVCLAEAYLCANQDSHNRIPASGEEERLVEIGSHCRGSIFRNADWLRTSALETAIDRVAKAHPGFFLGRFDIRTSSLEDLKAGHSFRVIELNGVGAEPAHIYDPAVSLIAAYHALFVQWKAAFEIGEWNRRRGCESLSMRDLFRLVARHPEIHSHERDFTPMQKEYARRA